MFTLTSDNINSQIKLALADPTARAVLQKDWRQFIVSHFDGGAAAVAALPADRVKAAQDAVSAVVQQGGAIRMSGTDPMLLVMKPNGPHPEFTCTITNKPNWSCKLK